METSAKSSSAAFWKSYFAKFRRPIEPHEVSETVRAPLSGASDASDQPAEARSRRRDRITLKNPANQAKTD